MGNWHISIQGVGVHHNGVERNDNNASDAEKMAEDFVKLLQSKGHWISKATITFGAAQQLAEPNGNPVGIDLTRSVRDQYGLTVVTSDGQKVYIGNEQFGALATLEQK